MKKMTDIYLVVQVGYEGIDELYRGFLNPDDAVEFVKETKKNIESHIEEEPDRAWMINKVKRICVMKGDENHEFECVCSELGVDKILDIGGELILYQFIPNGDEMKYKIILTYKDHEDHIFCDTTEKTWMENQLWWAFEWFMTTNELEK